MRTTAFWTEDYPQPASLAPTSCRVAPTWQLVGGGCTGLHAALALRRAGASVAVLEQETIG